MLLRADVADAELLGDAAKRLANQGRLSTSVPSKSKMASR